MSLTEKVLLVDDEPQVLVALEDVLEEHYTVLKTQSADEALEWIRRIDDIAVVLTDQRMPEMNGDELLKALGSECVAQRILVTGFADLSAVVRAINEGKVFAYVTKPWNTDDLRAKVDSAVDRYRLTRQLEHERRLLHDLMDNVPDGIAFRDAHGRFQRVNRPYAQLLGVASPDELVGKTIDEVMGERGAVPGWSADDARVLSRGEPLVDTIRVYGEQEERRYISETIAPIAGQRGASLGLINVARDVSLRLRTEDALRVNERRLREQSNLLNSILESMEDGVMVADSQRELLFFNRKLETLLGDPRGLVADDWSDALRLGATSSAPGARPQSDPLTRAIHGEHAAQAELLFRHAGKPDLLLSVTASPLKNDADLTVGAVALLRDITLQRQLQQQLLQSQKLEALGQLAGGIAHDFSNFLAVIQSYAHLIKIGLGSSHPALADLNEIMEAARRAAMLTRQLLVFGRRRVVEPRPADVNRVVQELEKMLLRLIGEHIMLRTRLAPGLPMVRIDESQLEQLVMNLSLNARDAMPDGGELTITTGLTDEVYGSAEGGLCGVVLTVTDTGEGMSPEVQRRIFEPFFTTKEFGKGTGLGLATVYGVVQQCQGRIDVNSSVGHGTTFRIELPPCLPEAAVVPVAEKASLPTARATATILLVEDDAALRAATARLLEARGYRVLPADSAEHARQLCAASNPPVDLVLTDVVMPEVNGSVLARELMGMQSSLRVLYMSGYVGTHVGMTALEEHELVLEKPFTPEQLERRIHRLLQD